MRCDLFHDGALAVVPLLAASLDDPDWLALDEAGDRARVTEVSEAAAAYACPPFLVWFRRSKQPLGRQEPWPRTASR